MRYRLWHGFFNTTLVALIAFTCVEDAYAQRGIRIAYVDMEYILEQVASYRDAEDALNEKALKWQTAIELKKSEVDELKEALALERAVLAESIISDREEDIRFLESEIAAEQQEKFGPKGEYVLQQELLIQPIQDQVFEAIQKIGKSKKYDFIFDKSADVVMLYSEKRHDISDLVLREIGRAVRLSQSKEDQEFNDRLKALQNEQELENDTRFDQEVLDRQKELEEAQEARQKQIEDRKAENLRKREERRKEYEARKKAALEKREAQRKAAIEARNKRVKKDSTNNN
ncbi:MAG: hypothetical protein CMC19_08780 [Flavobacteriaceae bacterium]|nr:hypothetical protein [Flavobacteriaceae bacterium]OUX39258.1 MAG: hypothetical protein CBE25_04600 [Flavobacteriaceae bacterium TMED265]